MHSLHVGVDGYCTILPFKNHPVPLTNAKGVFGPILGEYVATGVLFHAKYLRDYLGYQAQKKWNPAVVQLVKGMTILIVGYGNIGAASAKILKCGFGMKVIGISADPELITEEQRSYLEELVTPDKYDQYIGQADFVLGLLPKTPGTLGFFNMKTTFSKMKKSAVFMNIGRGPTHKCSDLIEALKTKVISGAVLDVFETEPLPESSELWAMDNVLMTPHCADRIGGVNGDWLVECMHLFAKNLSNFCEGRPIFNVTNKEKGY